MISQKGPKFGEGEEREERKKATQSDSISSAPLIPFYLGRPGRKGRRRSKGSSSSPVQSGVHFFCPTDPPPSSSNSPTCCRSLSCFSAAFESHSPAALQGHCKQANGTRRYLMCAATSCSPLCSGDPWASDPALSALSCLLQNFHLRLPPSFFVGVRSVSYIHTYMPLAHLPSIPKHGTWCVSHL